MPADVVLTVTKTLARVTSAGHCRPRRQTRSLTQPSAVAGMPARPTDAGCTAAEAACKESWCVHRLLLVLVLASHCYGAAATVTHPLRLCSAATCPHQLKKEHPHVPCHPPKQRQYEHCKSVLRRRCCTNAQHTRSHSKAPKHRAAGARQASWAYA